jgi:hypothetical protein
MAVKRGQNEKRMKCLARPEDVTAEARGAFVWVLAGRVPEMWKDLYATCAPRFEGMDVNHDPPPQVVEAVEAWARRWGLVDDTGAAYWAIRCALNNLSFREAWRRAGLVYPESAAVPLIDYHPASQKASPYAPAELGEFVFRATWPAGRIYEPLAVARKRILDQFTRALDEHLAKYKAWARQVGILELPVRRSGRQHLMWLADYQVRGLSVKELADAYAAETGRAIEERAIYKALSGVAQVVGLKLRKRRGY